MDRWLKRVRWLVNVKKIVAGDKILDYWRRDKIYLVVLLDRKN